MNAFTTEYTERIECIECIEFYRVHRVSQSAQSFTECIEFHRVLILLLDSICHSERSEESTLSCQYSLMSILTHVNTHPSIGRADSSLSSE